MSAPDELAAAVAGFRRYAASFLTGEPESDRSIQLKIDHSLRVLREAEEIAAADGFDPASTRLLRRAALLHDYGRFEQYRRWRTFRDDASCDHGALSAALVRRDRLLAELTPAERGVVLAAIRVHNARELPPRLTGAARRIAGAVRDADKLDILPILLDFLARPENGDVIWNLPPSDRLSPPVAAALRRGESPSYRDFRSATDFVASKLGWAFDLTTGRARSEFRRRGSLERLAAFLPETPEIAEICAKARKALEDAPARHYII